MSHSLLGRLGLMAIVLVVPLQVNTAHASDKELRFIISLKASPFASSASPHPIFPSLLLRVENRLNDKEITYEQFTLGLTNTWTSWLRTELYATPREILTADAPGKWKEVHGASTIFSVSRRYFSLINRNTLEWHVSDDFVRTRHQLKLHLKLNKSLRGFLLYEFRWDQDSMRVNMQTTALGLLWRVRPHWSLRLMLADEQNRRNRPQWSSVYFAGLSITVTL